MIYIIQGREEGSEGKGSVRERERGGGERERAKEEQGVAQMETETPRTSGCRE